MGLIVGGKGGGGRGIERGWIVVNASCGIIKMWNIRKNWDEWIVLTK